ncbi:MAG: aminoglycoside phosphotransferase family protein [Anaerolineaceae bacterium]|nr:aminoglycoside phosphotransferase family protein [Anaerolineaceae bacterium]
MPNLSIQNFLPQAIRYLQEAQPEGIPHWRADQPYEVTPLAQGEYNLNFLVRQGETQWVLRVNSQSEIGLSIAEQILYEYRTLQLLAPIDVAPQPYFVDASLIHLPYGVLGMAYCPGGFLDYQRDLVPAARLMARYHQLNVPEAQNHLRREEHPLSQTYNHCRQMAQVYLESDQADRELSIYLREVLDWAEDARHREDYFLRDPWQCLINTEVNNTNWIVNRATGAIHLVDWDKPMWGDPSHDLSHFRVPTTTLWKTDYRLSPADQIQLMTAYKDAITAPHLRDTIEERTRLRDPFNCMRAITWSAMAWVQYQQDEHLVKNADTFRKLEFYTDLAFMRSVFDPYLLS